MAKQNRRKVVDARWEKKTQEGRSSEGQRRINAEVSASSEKYDTSWFRPTEGQQEIIYSMIENPLTLVAASSGVGKSTTAVCHALKELSAGRYKKILFIKTPAEATDDPIGFLPNSASDKIAVHMEATRTIFLDFMSKSKLELDEKRGRIELTIPNFVLGKTFTDTFVIIDEAQQISPRILKLLIERCGEGSTYVVLGDKHQCYANKRRDNGLQFLIDKVTHVDSYGDKVSFEPLIGYVELFANSNMRSDLSRRIVEIFEGEG